MAGKNLFKGKTFVDTGAFIALGWQKDQYHEIAVNYYRSHRNDWQLYTSNHIVSETYTWLRYHVPPKNCLSFLYTIEQLQATGRLIIIYTDQETEAMTKELLKQYSDVKLSYVDALTGVLVAVHDISQIFGFDKHLNIFGKILLPGQEMI